jgi:hypothetical protein
VVRSGFPCALPLSWVRMPIRTEASPRAATGCLAPWQRAAAGAVEASVKRIAKEPIGSVLSNVRSQR